MARLPQVRTPVRSHRADRAALTRAATTPRRPVPYSTTPGGTTANPYGNYGSPTPTTPAASTGGQYPALASNPYAPSSSATGTYPQTGNSLWRIDVRRRGTRRRDSGMHGQQLPGAYQRHRPATQHRKAGVWSTRRDFRRTGTRTERHGSELGRRCDAELRHGATPSYGAGATPAGHGRMPNYGRGAAPNYGSGATPAYGAPAAGNSTGAMPPPGRTSSYTNPVRPASAGGPDDRYGDSDRYGSATAGAASSTLPANAVADTRSATGSGAAEQLAAQQQSLYARRRLRI